MACCLFLLRLLAPLAARLGLGEPAASAPRFPVVPAAVLGLVELAAAWVILRLDDPLVAAPTTASVGAHHAHHGMATDAAGVGTAVGAAVLALGVVATSLWFARRGRTPAAWAAVVVSGLTAVLALSPGVAGTHLLLMAVIEVCLILLPLAVVGTRRADGPADDVWVVARLALAAVPALLMVFLLVTLHLPATHDWYRSGEVVTWWLVPVLLASGVAFWAAVMRFRLPSAAWALLLVLALETGAMIGLVLLVAGRPLMAMDPALGLDLVADQRLAGALMMAVDLIVLARVVEPQLTGGRQSGETSRRSAVALAQPGR